MRKYQRHLFQIRQESLLICLRDTTQFTKIRERNVRYKSWNQNYKIVQVQDAIIYTESPEGPGSAKLFNTRSTHKNQ